MFIDDFTEDKSLSALKCLGSFLIPKIKKQPDKLSPYTSIPYLLIDAPVSTLMFDSDNSEDACIRDKDNIVVYSCIKCDPPHCIKSA